MTIFQDPRASALVDKIQAIHDAGFDKPLAPVSEQSIFSGAFKDGKICRDSFMKIFNEMVETKAREVQVVLADQIRENISGIKSIRNSLLFAIRNSQLKDFNRVGHKLYLNLLVCDADK